MTMTQTMTAAQFQQQPKRHKYRAVPVVIDGTRFASKAEGARYQKLRLLERNGFISELVCQPSYDLVVNTVKVGVYRADFRYLQDGRMTVEDVKGLATPVYKLKKRIVEALYNIEIIEVRA